jgi:mannose-1-phosphate guanylyltransferase
MTMTPHPYYAIIMAGGRGERFWPASTRTLPKQLLDLFDGKPLLVSAIERIEPLIPRDRILIITSVDLVGPIRQAMPGFPENNIIGEPVGRDTAAAIALGLSIIRDRSPDAVFTVLTADHVIRKDEVFRQTLAQGLDYASRHPVLLTIGIPPRYPSTGFGYIETGSAIDSEGPISFRKALRFVEKPDATTAEQYFQNGAYFWNSGMFIWSTGAIDAAFRKHQPPLADMADRLRGHTAEADFAVRLAREYSALEKISIDYAVMEKAQNILMAECAFEWDDVGTWTSLANHFPADEQGNVTIGTVAALDSSDSIVVSKNHITALLGINHLVVVQVPGVTLICDRDKAQDLKRLIGLLREQGLDHCL